MTVDRAKHKPRSAGLYFGYSTNVHRSESLRQIYRFLNDYTLPVNRRVLGDDRRGGLELRLGIAAATELAEEGKREELRAFLEQANTDVFSVNAFPLHDFQARRVKQKVYSPSWLDRERVMWTNRICRIFADLLAPGVTGSVSTLGGTYRPWAHGPSTWRRLAAQYLRTVEALADLAETRGKDIVLAVEPEPDTTFEIAADVIRFVEDYLLPAAHERWRGRYRTKNEVEEVVRRRFTVNLDTCHFSVLFHDPRHALTELHAAGIRVGKLHVTNALRLPNPARARKGYAALRAMDEPRFLHQFCGADASGAIVWRGADLCDLPASLEAEGRADVAELRTHFHVPLYLKRWKALRTTQEETRSALEETVARGLCSHLVLETYTWPVLVEESRLAGGIARELRWLVDVAEAALPAAPAARRAVAGP
jgi:hypothetical protein